MVMSYVLRLRNADPTVCSAPVNSSQHKFFLPIRPYGGVPNGPCTSVKAGGD